MELNTIIRGNSYEVIPEIIKDIKNPIIVTDPPFNVGYHYDEYKDRKDEREYIKDLAALFSLCPSVVIHYPEELYRIAMALNLAPNRVVSWVYNSNTPRQHRDIAYWNIEPNFKGLGEYINTEDKRIKARMAQGKKPRGYDWLYHDQIKNVSREKIGHPCQMPLAVMLYIVSTLPKGATIIEPFSGGGTTCLAAKRLGYDFIGVEMSAKYHRLALNRIANDAPLFD